VSAPTVLEESRSSLVALPALIGGVCVLVVGSMLIRGIPQDTSTRLATAVFVLAGVVSGLWFVRWSHIRPATLTVDDGAIVMTPRGRGQHSRTIVRRSDSQLRVRFLSEGTNSPSSFRGYVLYDDAVGEPHISVDIYGVDRVKAACGDHGWVVTDA
jgi:hypothetical protein